MIVVCQKAERDAVLSVVREVQSVHLFANKRLPTRYDGVADYVEVEGGGYEPLIVDPNLWAIEEADGGTVASYPKHTWTFSGAAGYVHGWYVVDGKGQLRWAEALSPGPFLAANPGDIFILGLEFAMRRAQR